MEGGLNQRNVDHSGSDKVAQPSNHPETLAPVRPAQEPEPGLHQVQYATSPSITALQDGTGTIFDCETTVICTTLRDVLVRSNANKCRARIAAAITAWLQLDVRQLPSEAVLHHRIALPWR